MVLGWHMYLRHGEPGMNEAREANLALRPFRLARPFPTVFRRPVRPLKYYLSKSSRERKTAAVDRVREVKTSAAQKPITFHKQKQKQTTTTQRHEHGSGIRSSEIRQLRGYMFIITAVLSQFWTQHAPKMNRALSRTTKRTIIIINTLPPNMRCD